MGDGLPEQPRLELWSVNDAHSLGLSFLTGKRGPHIYFLWLSSEFSEIVQVLGHSLQLCTSSNMND